MARSFGSEVLPARKLVKFPGRLANRNIMFMSHIVNSDIPMLWSRAGMEKAGVVLDMNGDGAWIFNTWVDLKLTKAGHYALDILSKVKELVMMARECFFFVSNIFIRVPLQIPHPT